MTGGANCASGTCAFTLGITGGTISGLTANTIPKASNATALTDSPITISGSTVQGILGSIVPPEYDYVVTQTDAANIWAYAITWQSTADVVAGGGSRIHRSTDAGQTWADTGAGSYFAYPQELNTIPGGTDLVVQTNGQGPYTSTDNGANWTAHGASIDGLMPWGFVGAKTIAALSSTVFLSGGTGAPAFGGVFRSTNAGTTWLRDNAGGVTTQPNDDTILVVSSDPSSASVAWAGTGETSADSGVYKSTDAGVTWARAGGATLNANVSKISAVSGAVWAGTNAGVFLSTDGGATWSLKTGAVTVLGLWAASASEAWYAESGGAVYHTGDGGASWDTLARSEFGNGNVYAIRGNGAGAVVSVGRYGAFDMAAAEKARLVYRDSDGAGWAIPGSIVDATTGALTLASVGLPGAVTWTAGSGAPAGACTTGSLYSRTDGGAGTTLYVCESTSWVGK